MKRISAVCVLFLHFAVCSAFEFEFYNNTDFDILHIYAMPCGADHYSGDLLGPFEYIAPLESIPLYLHIPDGEPAALWTLMCVESGGRELTVSGIPLQSVGSVSLEWSAFFGAQWEAE